MRHLSSALLLGVLLAMVLVLVSWDGPPQSGGNQGKNPFARPLNQLDLIDAPPAH